MIALAVVVIPSFIVVYGWQSGGGTGPTAAPPVAATLKYGVLDEREIAAGDMQRGKQSLLSRLENYSNQQGQRVDRGTLNRLVTVRPILNEAINLAILERYAQEHGLAVSTDEAIEYLKSMIPEQYREAQQRQWEQEGRRVSDVVEELRQSMLIDKVRRSLGSRVRVTNYEAWLAYAENNTKLTLTSARFDVGKYLDQVQVNPAELEEYFKTNQEKYRIPDQVQYRYLLLRKDDLRSSVSVTEDELISAYATMQEEFRLPPTAKVRDIFLKKPTEQDLGTTAAEELTSRTEEVRIRAQDISQRIAKGESFATLADQFSELQDFPPREDEGTTAADSQTTAGGNLGLISQTVAKNYFGDEWTSAVFTAASGQLVGPIETPTGFHIAMVEQKREGVLQSLDKVRELVRNRLLEQKVEPLFQQEGEKLRAAEEKFPNLEQLARESGYQLNTSPKIERTAPFIPQVGLLGDFQADIQDLEKGGRTTLLSDANRHLIVEIAEEFPEHIPTLEEVRDRVANDFKQHKALELARAAAESVLKKSTDLESLKTASGDAGSTATQTRPFLPTEAETIVGPVRNFAELAPKLKPGEIRLEPLALRDSLIGYVVFHVTNKEEPTQKDFAAELPKLLPRLIEQKQEIVLNEFLRDRREAMKDNIEVTEYYQ